jgi:hypothetical protein
MRKKNTKSGLTLVEMLVVTSLSTMVLVGMMSMIALFYKSNSYTLGQAYEVSNARRGLELMVRDLREMTYGDDGAYPLVTAGAHEVAFYSDIDRDNSVELVRYRLSTTTITKTITNATGTPPRYNATPDETRIVSEYVRNISQATSTFLYYDENGASVASTSITDVRYIRATVIVNIDPNRDPDEFTLSSSASLRNLKTSF